MRIAKDYYSELERPSREVPQDRNKGHCSPLDLHAPDQQRYRRCDAGEDSTDTGDTSRNHGKYQAEHEEQQHDSLGAQPAVVEERYDPNDYRQDGAGTHEPIGEAQETPDERDGASHEKKDLRKVVHPWFDMLLMPRRRL